MNYIRLRSEIIEQVKDLFLNGKQCWSPEELHEKVKSEKLEEAKNILDDGSSSAFAYLLQIGSIVHTKNSLFILLPIRKQLRNIQESLKQRDETNHFFKNEINIITQILKLLTDLENSLWKSNY